MKASLFFILYFVLGHNVNAQKIPCPGTKNVPPDTTIVLENGTELTFNRCEFFDIKDCLEISEIRTLNDIEANGLSLMDNQGEVLLTCGMLAIKITTSDDCSNKECLDHPVKVRIPMLGNPCLVPTTTANSVYRLNASKKWEKIDDGKEVLDKNGRRYFEFYTKCPAGTYNCDKRLGTIKVKFKSKRPGELISLKVTANCPPLSLVFDPKKRKKIILAKLPCLNPDSLQLTIISINQSGLSDTTRMPLSKLRSRYTKSTCNITSFTVKRRILGIFPLYERNVYRKYIID